MTLQDPVCRIAMEWLIHLAVVAVDRTIAGIALQLADQSKGAVASEVAQAANPGPDVIAVLQREPQAGRQALLKMLEPI